MIRLLALLLFALPCTAFAQDDQAPARAAATCATCSGKGEVLLPCGHCDGDGVGPCADCALDLEEEVFLRALAVMGLHDAENAEEVAWSGASLGRAAFRANLIETGLVAPHPPGRLGCPAACRGRAPQRGRSCQNCADAGVLACDACEGRGEAPCFRCAGKKERVVPCRECSGQGVGFDPLARTKDARACPWCADVGWRVCEVCDESGKDEHHCLACGQDGWRRCGDCAGTRRAACDECSGTGDTRKLKRQDPRPCDRCAATGKVACKPCDGAGRVRCATCKGAGKGRANCATCLGHKKAPCEGCWHGSSRAWVVTAERLLTARRKPAALAHMKLAVARAKMRRTRTLMQHAGTPEERAALERGLDAEVDALEARLAEMSAGD